MRGLVFVLAFVLASCATRPSDEQMRNADYGPPPANFDQLVRDYLATYLRDPMSAQIQHVGGPGRYWNGFGGSFYGYAVCYRINARNGFGGYTGNRLYAFLIRDGRIQREFHDDGEQFSIGRAVAEGACADNPVSALGVPEAIPVSPPKQ
jgi:hypothetical protein